MANAVNLALDQAPPPFKGIAVQNGLFKEVSLDDFKGKYLVILFFPCDFSENVPSSLPRVPNDVLNFSRRLRDFHALDCEVLAISTDSPYVHRAYSQLCREHGGLGDTKIILLADNDLSISRAYGFLKEDEGLAFNGVVILNKDSEVKHVVANDFPVEFDVGEIVRVVAALQSLESNDYLMCTPANWKPGEPTIDLSKN